MPNCILCHVTAAVYQQTPGGYLITRSCPGGGHQAILLLMSLLQHSRIKYSFTSSSRTSAHRFLLNIINRHITYVVNLSHVSDSGFLFIIVLSCWMFFKMWSQNICRSSVTGMTWSCFFHSVSVSMQNDHRAVPLSFQEPFEVGGMFLALVSHFCSTVQYFESQTLD